MNPDTAFRWRSALGGRRFLLCMGASLVNSALFAVQLLSEQGYLTTFGLTVGSYLAASGWQKHVETRAAADSK